MVLVRDTLPEHLRLPLCLCVYQLGTFFTGGGFTVWTGIAFIVALFFAYMLFRPDPYKNQKVYSKRSVQQAA